MFKVVSSTKDYNGVYEIVITFDGVRTYTYFLTSEYAHRKFLRHCTFGRFKKALRILKDFNRKELYDDLQE